MPRGQRRAFQSESHPDRQLGPGQGDPRRATATEGDRDGDRDRDRDRDQDRDRETERDASAERRVDRIAERTRYFLGGRPAHEAELGGHSEDIRRSAYLFEDPLLNESVRRVPEGVLRARRHVLTHEESRLLRDSSAQADPISRDMSSNSHSNPPPQPSRDLQRRFSREPVPRRSDTQLPSFASLTGSAASLPPLRNLNNQRSSSNLSSLGGSGGRPPRQRPERLMDRYRHPEHRQPNPASFEDLGYDLGDANSQLRALLEYTNTTITSPLSPQSNSHMPQHDQADDSRRAKRRKLDSERPGSSFKGFRYGRFGQVEPGPLKMEIDTCDGGMYADDENNPPESILKVDGSVYCTKRDFCNIVLRHQGATVFSLSELVIRAPGPRFSSPVREGMVFVTMASDDIFSRTAQYKVKYIQSQDSLTAERIPIVSVRHNEDGTTTSYARLRRARMQHHIEDPTYYSEAVFPADPLPFPVTIATDCSDPEDHMPTNTRSRRPAPNRIGQLPFESDSSEDGENVLGRWDDLSFNENEDTPPPNHLQRRTQDMTLAEAAEASQLATQEAVQAVGGKLLRPHAKFFIEKGKNRCTIRFDPPVTGRFILLKMYHPSENIDIQGVYAKGFAGPRYFPSVDLR